MKITTINGKETNISGIGEAILKLPGGTIIRIENAIHIPTARKNLLSYKDFRNNDLHVSTATRLGKECLLITKCNGPPLHDNFYTLYSFSFYILYSLIIRVIYIFYISSVIPS
jgi:hypothetical protein